MCSYSFLISDARPLAIYTEFQYFPVGTLKRALQFNWHVLLEDIGLWIPSEVSHTEHDDKPENEPEGLFFVFIYEVQSIHGLSSNNCVLFTFVVVVIDYILKFSK
mgnify:CR=1 FL=1